MISTLVNRVQIKKVINNELIEAEDELATEEPLEIQCSYFLKGVSVVKSISVTMRTPGNDEELAAGFLFTEGIINNYNQVQSIGVPLFPENNVIVSLIE